MNDVQRNEISSLIDREVARLGTASRVAKKCQVSDATISVIRNGKWDQVTDEMWAKVAHALNYQTSGWQIVNTLNYRLLETVMSDAKNESIWFAVSHRAGSGKTATLRHYADVNANKGVFYIQCREWNRRDFLLAICRELGIETNLKGYVNMDTLGELIVDYFNSRRVVHPLLIIDEADKLRHPALRYLIPLYNATEGILGCVIAGTDNLETEIKRGVKYCKKGFDEIDSRFGRQFVHLIGATKADVRTICNANGITEPDMISEIWKEAGPRPIVLHGQQTSVVDDLRRLRRIIIRERIKMTSHVKGNQPDSARAGI